MSGMKGADERRRKILCHLSDGLFHSGEALGEKLGLSRAAVSNHIQVLQTLGLDIYSVKGKGYRLSKPLYLLDQPQISQLCPEDLNIEVLHVIDSTNTYMKHRQSTASNGDVCIAEAQTAGRGRQGRQWHSPFGSSLYLSMFWNFSGGYQSVTGLSLVIGIAVSRTLDELGLSQCELKWPNDIYMMGKKLGGVLIEIEGQPDSHCHSIIGVGLNIDLPQQVDEIDQPWTDLTKAGLINPDRNQICALLLKHLYQIVSQFEFEGMSPFIDEWKKRDIYAGTEITLNMGNNRIEGIARGINTHGAILVEVDGQVKAFYGGEISVRAR